MLSEEGVSRLEAFLKLNEDAQKILTSAPSLKLPNWYLGAGCISQTVWNVLHGFSPGREIKDYDLVYYDSSDLSFETEDSHIQQAKRLFQNIPVPVEVRNEARVHLWYPEKFGFSINPYGSVEKAIASWPTTATCVGVKYVGKGFHVYAPYGLDDLFAMLVRPNKVLIKKQVYEEKVNRWSAAWPKLRVIPWDE
ncbi:MAG TPA: nucleotidyltransferase family protein [Candidatus Acidoferrales bacterium]|nr:nucleotidyltransferase family protein [Candidatus Acidoferrales bacterium]